MGARIMTGDMLHLQGKADEGNDFYDRAAKTLDSAVESVPKLITMTCLSSSNYFMYSDSHFMVVHLHDQA